MGDIRCLGLVGLFDRLGRESNRWRFVRRHLDGRLFDVVDADAFRDPRRAFAATLLRRFFRRRRLEAFDAFERRVGRSFLEVNVQLRKKGRLYF